MFIIVFLIAATMTVVSFTGHPMIISAETSEAFKTYTTSVSAALSTWESLKKETTTDRLRFGSDSRTGQTACEVVTPSENTCSTENFQVVLDSLNVILWPLTHFDTKFF